MPQKYVVEEVVNAAINEQEEQSHAAHTYHQDISDAFVHDKLNAHVDTDIENTNKIKDGGGNTKFWHSPKRKIYIILKLARNPAECGKITTGDMEKVYKYLNYNGWWPRQDKKELRSVSIRILSYLAQQRWHIDDKFVDAIFEESIFLDDEMVSDCVLVASYMIHNGQKLKPIFIERFKSAISKIKEKSYEGFSTQPIALAALTKIEHKPSNEDWNFLQFNLKDYKDVSYLSAYPKNQSVSFITIKKGFWGRIKKGIKKNFWRYRVGKILNKAKNGGHLSELEFYYILRKWSKAKTRTKSKEKIIQIIKFAAINGQYHYPEPYQYATRSIPDILQEALTHEERNLNNTALLIMGLLLVNNVDANGAYHFLDRDIKNKLAQRQKYSLIALNHFYRLHKKDVSVDWSTWIIVLTEALNHTEGELKRYIEFSLNYIQEKLDGQESLLLDVNFCIDISALFKDAAENSMLESKIAIKNLIVLIYESQKYPLIARENAALALAFHIKWVVEDNSQKAEHKIDDSDLAKLQESITSNNDFIINNLLIFFGYYVRMDASAVLVSNIYTVIEQQLKKWNKNAGFILASITKLITKDMVTKKLCALLNLSCSLLEEENTDAGFLKNILSAFSLKKIDHDIFIGNILSALNNAVQNLEIIFSQDKINSLSKFLVTIKSEAMLNKLLIVIGLMVDKSEKSIFTKRQLMILLDFLFSNNSNICNDAEHLLSTYFKKTEVTPGNVIIEEMISRITHEQNRVHVGNLLKIIANRAWVVNPGVITYQMSLIDFELETVKYNALEALTDWAKIQKFNAECIEHIQKQLCSRKSGQEKEIKLLAKLLLHILKYHSKNKINAVIHDETCLKLSELISEHALDEGTIKCSVQSLLILSQEQKKLSDDVWIGVLSALNIQYQKNITMLMDIINIQLEQLNILTDNNKNMIDLIKFIELSLKRKKYSDLENIKQITSILQKACQKKYILAEDTIDMLSDMILFSETDISDLAYHIGTAIDPDTLTEKAKQIIKIEEQIFRARFSKSIDEKQQILRDLIKITTEDTCFSQNALILFDVIFIKDLSQDVMDALFYLCDLAVSNKQKLPNTLIKKICHKLESGNKIKAALIVQKAVENGQFIEAAYYTVFEKLLFEDVLHSAEYLSVLAGASARGYILNQKIIDFCFRTLVSENKHIKKIAVSIIRNTAYQQNGPQYFIEDIINKVILVDELTAQDLVKILQYFICERSVTFAGDLLKLLSKKLYDTEDLALKETLLNTFHKINNKDKALEMDIKYEELNYQFLAANFLSEKNKILAKILEYNRPLSNQIFDIILFMLTSEDYVEINETLKNINNADFSEHHVPNNVLCTLASLLLNDETVTLVKKFFEKNKINIQTYPDDVLNIFKSCVLIHRNDDVRSVILDILNKLNDAGVIADDEIKEILVFESKAGIDVGNYKSLLSFINKKTDGKIKLTYNNYFHLIDALSKSTNREEKIGIVKILDTTKAHIPLTLHKKMLSALVTRDGLNNPNDEFVTLISFIFDKNEIEINFMEELMSKLYTVIKSRHMHVQHVSVLAVLNSKIPLQVDFDILERLINFSIQYQSTNDMLKVKFTTLNLIHAMVKNTHAYRECDIKNILKLKILLKRQKSLCKIIYKIFSLLIVGQSDRSEKITIFSVLNKIEREQCQNDKRLEKYAQEYIGHHAAGKISKASLCIFTAGYLDLSEAGNDILSIFSEDKYIEALSMVLVNSCRKIKNIDDNVIVEFNKILKRLFLSQSIKLVKDKMKLLFILIDKQEFEHLSLQKINKMLSIIIDSEQLPFSYLLSNRSTFKIKTLKELVSCIFPKEKIEQEQFNRINKLVEENRVEYFDFKKMLLSIDFTTHKQLIEFLLFCSRYQFNYQHIHYLHELNKYEKLKYPGINQALKISFLQTKMKEIPMNNENAADFQKVIDHIVKLLNNDWTFESVYFYFKDAKVDSLTALLTALDMALEFKIQDKTFFDILKKNPLNYLEKLHKVTLDGRTVTYAAEKSLQKLLDETNIPSIKVEEIKLIESLYLLSKLPSGFSNTLDLPPVCKWSYDHVKAWANFAKANIEKISLSEQLAVINRLVYLYFGFKLKNTQIIAIFAFIKEGANVNVFQQINTGEGKSIITTILASLNVLQGKKVDVVTSSKLLALRDSERFEKFYSTLNIKVATNKDEDNVKGEKACYASEIDVIYSSVSQLQFDILRHEYSELKTRGEKIVRPFDVLIMDEADKSLIDEADKLAMLSETMPAMNYINDLHILIWDELKKIHENMTQIGNKVQYRQVNSSNNEIEITELELSEKANKIKELLTNYAAILTNPSTDNQFIWPKHFAKLIQIQIPKWIESAQIAYQYCYKHHYDVKCDEKGHLTISPIDYLHTGETQNGTHWSDGLQQFLQSKHGLRLSPEHLTTNFISNVAFVKRYNKTFGLTGTLGSSSAQQILQTHYDAKTIIIPPNKEKALYRYQPILAKNKIAWINDISRRATQEARLGRTTLVICETQKKATRLYKKMCEIYSPDKISLYIDSDEADPHFIENFSGSGNIIIATNLAGRGTDIKIPQSVIAKGGLHVSLTFMPVDKRIEDQAVGRVARNGEPGSAEMILDCEAIARQYGVSTDKVQTFEQIQTLRNNNEKEMMKKIHDDVLPKAILKDEVFKQFCELLQDLRQIDKENQSKAADTTPFYKQIKIKAVEEKWGIWLKEYDFNKDPSKALHEFPTFKQGIIKNYKDDKIIENYCHYLKLGHYYLMRSDKLFKITSQKKLLEKAKFYFEAAEKADPTYAYLANYYLALTLVKLGGIDNKMLAIKKLTIAKGILNDKLIPQKASIINSQENMEYVSIDKEKKHADYMSNQLKLDAAVLSKISHDIDSLINKIERSQKLMEIEISSERNTKIYKKISDTNIKDIEPFLPKADGEQQKLTMRFHDLHSHMDIVRQYPAIKTLSCLKKEEVSAGIYFKNNGEYDINSWKDILKNLLPINYRKQNKSNENAQATTDDKKKSTIQYDTNGIGIVDTLSHTSSYATKKVVAASQTVAGVVAKGGEAIVDKYDKLWLKIDKLKAIPVNLTIYMSTDVNIKDIPEQKANNARLCLVLNFQNELTGIPSEVFEYFKEKGIVLANSSKSKIGDNFLLEKNTIFAEKVEELTKINKLIIRGVDKNAIQTKLSQLFDFEYFKKPLCAPSARKLKLLNITQEYASDVIEKTKALMKLNFTTLDFAHAISLIKFDTKVHDKFTLRIFNLNQEKIKLLLEKAKREQQGFKVTLTPLEDEIPLFSMSKMDLYTWQQNGLYQLYDITERNPLQWRAMTLLLALAAVQIIAAAIFAVTSFGLSTQVSIECAMNGFNDVIQAIHVYCGREFSLKSYTLGKIIAYSMLIASASYRAYQLSNNSVRAASEAIKLARGAEGIQDTSTGVFQAAQFVSTGSKVTNKLVHVAENGMYNAKEIFSAGAKKTAREVFDKSVRSSSKNLTNLVEQPTYREVQNQLKNTFSKREDWQKSLQRIFAIDHYAKENVLQKELKTKIINHITETKMNVVNEAFSNDLSAIDFEQKFSSILNEINAKLPSFQNLLTENAKEVHVLNEQQIGRVCTLLREQKILNGENEIDLSPISKYTHNASQGLFSPMSMKIDEAKLDLKEMNSYKGYIIQQCKLYHAVTTAQYTAEKTELFNSIAKQFTKKRMQTTQLFVDGMTTFVLETINVVDMAASVASGAKDFIDGRKHKKIDPLAHTRSARANADVQSMPNIKNCRPVRPESRGQRSSGFCFQQNFKSRHVSIPRNNVANRTTILHKVATSIAKDVNTLIFKATVNLVKESVRYQYMKSLQSEMDTQLVKLRKLSLEKYLNDEKVKKEVMVAKKRHIRILIACIIFDKVSAESLSSKVDEIYLCSTKDFDNGYTYIKHALKAEIKSESDENFLKQIKQIFWEIKMDRVLDIVGTNVTPDSIQNLTGEITNLVRTRNFTAADQMLANGQLSPAAYIGTTVVSSISGYLKASQENERALTIMINQISHDVIASSEKMITKMVELSEKKMDLVKHITNKCNEIIENAAKDAQDKIFQLQTQGIDYERITQFSQGNAKLALAALNAEEKTLTSAIDAINGNLKTATEAANKQCESLKSIINDLTKDEAKFFGECIEFYKNMITRAQNTLDGVRKDNVSIVKKLIDEGASLLKETIVSKKTDLESQDESKKQSTSIGDAKTTTTTSTSTTSSNAESATQDNTTEATKTTSTTTTTNAEAMRNFGMHSTKKEASQNADVAELDWPEGIEYRQNDTNGMHELVITIRKLRSSDKFQSICDKINEFRDDADKSIKSEQGYCTMIGFNDPRNIKELYDEINKLSADASPKMQQ